MYFYFFGFNGFDQFIGENDPLDEVVKRLSDCDRIRSVALSWSKFCYIRDESVIIRGVPKENQRSLDTTTVDVDPPYSFVQVACSFGHVAVVSSDGLGKIFKVCDNGLEEILNVHPGDCWKITSCSLGDSDAVFINSDGRVIWVALNSQVLESPVLPIAWKVTAVSCGKEHVLLLSETETVYSFGQGRHGQLGHGCLEPEDGPRIVECLEGIHISGIAAGGWHSAAVSREGDLYTWGWNETGQLGFQTKKKISSSKVEETDGDAAIVIQAVPKCVEFPEEVFATSVTCGSRHTLVLTDHGRLWSFGWNSYGQLGKKSPDLICKPCEVQFFRTNQLRVTKIYSGGWSSLVQAEPIS